MGRGLGLLELGKLEEFAHQARESLAAADRGVEVLRARRLVERVALELQRLEVTVEARERGAQVMRDVGDHVAPQGILVADVLEQPADVTRHLVEGGGKLVHLVAFRVRAQRGHRRQRLGEAAAAKILHRRIEPPQPAGQEVEDQQAGQQAEQQARAERPTAQAQQEALAHHPFGLVILLAP